MYAFMTVIRLLHIYLRFHFEVLNVHLFVCSVLRSSRLDRIRAQKNVNRNIYPTDECSVYLLAMKPCEKLSFVFIKDIILLNLRVLEF